MALFTKTELRQLLSRDVSREWFMTGTVAADGTVDECVVPEFIDRGVDVMPLVDLYVYHPAGVVADRTRRIIEYTPDDGRVRFHRPMGIAPTATAIELHRFNPDLLNLAVNEGLSRCTFLDELTITPVANQYTYDLTAAASWLTEKRQVNGVYNLRDNGVREDLMWARPREDGGNLYLDLAPPFLSATGYTLVIEASRPFAALATDAATVTIDELWIRAAMRVQFYKRLVQGTTPSKEMSRYAQLARDALADFRRHAKLHTRKPPTKVTMSAPTWRLIVR